MLKSIAVAILSGIIISSTMINDCEAKSNVLDDVIKIFSNNNTSSNRKRVNNSDPAPKQINFNLDGNYSSIYFDSSIFKKTSVVSEHYFTLDRPAEVNLHFIGHTRRYYGNLIYDSDSNQLGGYTSVNESAKDRNIILSPGRYVIKTKVDGNNGQNKKDIDFEIKGTKNDIYPTIISPNYKRHEATILPYNIEVVDYFPHATSTSPRMKYYKVVVDNPCEIKFLVDKLSQNCNISYALLDEDERILEYFHSFNDDHIECSVLLNSGIYYLRAKRSDSGGDDGGVYSIKIK